MYGYSAGNSPSPISCSSINFLDHPIISYGGGAQDKGIGVISSGGSELEVSRNGWKAIYYPYEITENTVLEFEFASPVQGEEHVIGFNDNLSLSNFQRFKLYGTQNTTSNGHAIGDFENYNGSGNFQKFVIPIGEYYTGTHDYLYFASDDD